MEEKIIIENLTNDSVEIKKEQYTNGFLSNIWRKCYINSSRVREDLEKELEDKYVNAILLVWGNTPTVTENTAQ